MEAVVLEAVRCQLLGVRRPAWAAERARGAEAHVVEQNDQDVRRAGRWAQLRDGRELRVRVLRIVGRQRDGLAVRNRQYLALNRVVGSHRVSPRRMGTSVITPRETAMPG